MKERDANPRSWLKTETDSKNKIRGIIYISNLRVATSAPNSKLRVNVQKIA